MANLQTREPAPPPAPLRKPDQEMFDRWLREDLARRFGQTAREKLPDALLRLLTEH